jgi:signal recognition particle receptor subunit alpha
MIDHFAIFLNSGIGLWNWNSTETKLKGKPVENLVRTMFIEGKTSESQWNYDAYTLQWSFANDLDLIFVVNFLKWSLFL